MQTIAEWLKRTFGLQGSWLWACKQMDKGRIVYRTSDSGAAKYKLDHRENRRIVWAFAKEVYDDTQWDSAYLFLSDLECTSWAVWSPPTS